MLPWTLSYRPTGAGREGAKATLPLSRGAVRQVLRDRRLPKDIRAQKPFDRLIAGMSRFDVLGKRIWQEFFNSAQDNGEASHFSADASFRFWRMSDTAIITRISKAGSVRQDGSCVHVDDHASANPPG